MAFGATDRDSRGTGVLSQAPAPKDNAEENDERRKRQDAALELGLGEIAHDELDDGRTAPLAAGDWTIIAGLALAPAIVGQIVKRLRFARSDSSRGNR